MLWQDLEGTYLHLSTFLIVDDFIPWFLRCLLRAKSSLPFFKSSCLVCSSSFLCSLSSLISFVSLFSESMKCWVWYTRARITKALVSNCLTSGCLLCIKFKGIDRRWRTSLCWEWRGWSTHKNLWKHIQFSLNVSHNNVQKTVQPPAARAILLG